MKTARIALLHTAPAHIPTFEKLLAQDGVELQHTVKEEWLSEAQRDGLSDSLVERISGHLSHLAKGADAVVCSCSTIGPVAQNLGLSKVFRVDQPMMTLAAQSSPVLLAMCLASTEAPSTELLLNAFSNAGLAADYQCLLCSDAWHHFENNDLAEFGLAIAADIKKTIAENKKFGCVVLAQASMAAAQPCLEDLGIPVYSSPSLAAEQALAIARAESNTVSG